MDVFINDGLTDRLFDYLTEIDLGYHNHIPRIQYNILFQHFSFGNVIVVKIKNPGLAALISEYLYFTSFGKRIQPAGHSKGLQHINIGI